MCGIIGTAVASHDDVLNIESTKAKIGSAMELMKYRGPDASSVWVSEDGRTAFGHLRLSIHDLSSNGTQPMTKNIDGRGSFTIAFNGEIYNFIELREELRELGYTFTTQTDTEVALYSFVAWGHKCFELFNGMFAIAIWSDAEKTLTMARDMSGEKPLFYHLGKDDKISFASELKALMHLCDLAKPSVSELNPALIGMYMDSGFIAGREQLGAPDFISTESKVRDLAPGHLYVWGANYAYMSSIRKSIPYNLFQYKEHYDTTLSYQECIEKTRKIIKRSCELRLRADVPVGVFLSGGLDSSVVVAQLSELGHKVKTFSVKYDLETFGLGFDESMYARQIANQFGTEHHEITMTPQMFVDYLEQYIKVMDSPVTEAAAISLHYVSELAKKHVTVVLSGEGSDEIFAGYELYRTMAFIEKMRAALTPFGAKIVSSVAQKIAPRHHKIQKYLRWLDMPLDARYRGISSSDPRDKYVLLTPKFQKSLKNSEGFNETELWLQSIFDKSKDWPLLERMMDYDRHTWLVNDLLVKADRMSMHSSLELRVPFLDPVLIQHSINLPASYKIHKKDPKRILKDAYPELPDNIRYREKTGFPTPLAQMFKNGPLLEKTKMELQEGHPVFQILNFDACETMLKEHITGDADHHAALWRILVLALWVRYHCRDEVPHA